VTHRFPTRGRLRPAMVAAVAVAIIATGSAYLAMVGFGTDVLEQGVAIAYTTAGVFELSLITVALLAREAAKENRPNGTLLTLTWVLSSASGVFAAWHELFLGHELGAAVFRFLVPLLAALMWHLALIGDRHLASGRTWSSLRENARMHTLFLSIDAERRARQARRQRGGRLADLRVDRAERRRLRARAVALRTVPPAEVRAQVATWSDALAAVDEATAEAVALADEDAARMTIHADLSPRRDRLTVTVPDQDETAVEQLADATQLAVEAGVVDAPEEAAANSTSDDTYEVRAADAVDAELSVIAGETNGHTRFAASAITQAEEPAPAQQTSEEAARSSIPRTGVRKLSDGDLFTAWEMRQQGASWEAIGKALGVSKDTPRRALQAAGRAPVTPARGTPVVENSETTDAELIPAHSGA
jgi:hypothetical protein